MVVERDLGGEEEGGGGADGVEERNWIGGFALSLGARHIEVVCIGRLIRCMREGPAMYRLWRAQYCDMTEFYVD